MKKFLIIAMFLFCCSMNSIMATVFSKKYNIHAFSNEKWKQENKILIALLHHIPITVIAPSSGVDKKVLSILYHLPSLQLRLPTYLNMYRSDSFSSKTIARKFACLEHALCSETAGRDSVVWALRGGYTTTLLMSGLQKLKQPNKEKIFIGFSDMTPLHLFLTQQWGWKTIHGSVLAQLLDPYYDPINFIKIAEIITKKVTEISLDGLSPINSIAANTQVVSGRMTGGNLILVEASIATFWQIQTEGKILFLEVDTIQGDVLTIFLNHFNQVGLLQKVRAILFGCIGNENQEITYILNNWASNLKVPVFKTDKVGHQKYNYPIIYNTESKILCKDGDAEKKFSLVMKVGAIAKN